MNDSSLQDVISTSNLSLASTSRFTISPTISFIGYVISFVYRSAFWVLTLVTYHIPRWTYAVLSWGGVISLELNAIKIFLVFVAFSIAVNWTIKARYLNRYTKLRETPLRTDEKLDLHPDVATDPATAGINNYLDEFCWLHSRDSKISMI